MRMESGNREHVAIAGFGCMPIADTKELGIDPVMHHADVRPVESIMRDHVLARGFRYRDEKFAAMRRGVEKEPPERKVEPAKILRVPPMLEIVEDGDGRAWRQGRRGESGIQQNIDAVASQLTGENKLFPGKP